MSADARLAVAEHRINAVEGIIQELADSQRTVSESMTKIAAVHEAAEKRHADMQGVLTRIFEKIDRHDTDITEIKSDIGYLKEARGWVIGGCAALMLIGVSAIGFLIRAIFHF